MTRPSMPWAPLHLPLQQRRQCLQAGAMLLAQMMPPLLPGLAAQPTAAPTARLRWGLERDTRRLEVGDAIDLRLEVWVSTWFQAAVDFPTTLSADGALVEVVGGSPESRFEQQGGQRWTGLIRRYRLLPLQPGDVSVTLPASLTVLPGGGDGRPLQLLPPAPLRLAVRLPAGAEDIQPFVAARQLTLQQRWWPDVATAAAPLQVGDLVQREVVLVTDSSSPLMPAFDFGAPDGVVVRTQAATSQETRSNAAATATLTRRQAATYTLQQPGQLALPPVELVWWDLTQRRRRVTRLDGLSLTVRPAVQREDPFAQAPSIPTSEAATSQATMPPSWWWALGAAVGMGTALHAVRRWRLQTAVTPTSPSATVPARRLWSDLRRACLGHDAAAAMHAFDAVWHALPPDTRETWLVDSGLAEARADLVRHRFGPAQTGAGRWRGDALWLAVRRLRSEAEATQPGLALPPLHP